MVVLSLTPNIVIVSKDYSPYVFLKDDPNALDPRGGLGYSSKEEIPVLDQRMDKNV